MSEFKVGDKFRMTQHFGGVCIVGAIGTIHRVRGLNVDGHTVYEVKIGDTFQGVNDSVIEPLNASFEGESALRFDDGKVDFTLIPVDAQEAEARVWSMGEKKYGRDNWTKLWGLETRVKVMKSIMRHGYAILRGEDLDPESGLPHAAHIRCNCAMLIRDYENRKAGV